MSGIVIGECVCGKRYRLQKSSISNTKKCMKCGRPLKILTAPPSKSRDRQSHSSLKQWIILVGCSSIILIAALSTIVITRQRLLEQSPIEDETKNNVATASSPTPAEPKVVATFPKAIDPSLDDQPVNPGHSAETIVAGWPTPIVAPEVMPSVDGQIRFKNQPNPLHYDVPSIRSIAVSPDGRWLVSGGWTNGKENEVVLWDLQINQPKWIYNLQEPVNKIVFSPDGSLIAFLTGFRNITVIQLKDKELVCAFRNSQDISVSIAFTTDGKQLITTGWEGTFHIFDAFQGTELGTLKDESATPSRRMIQNSTVLEFLNDKKTLVTVNSESVLLWDFSVKRLLKSFQHGFQFRICSALSSTNNIIAVAGQAKPLEYEVRLWNAETGKSLGTLKQDKGELLCLKIASDGNTIIGGGTHGEIFFWKMGTSEPFRTIEAHAGSVFGVAVLSDDQFLITTGTDKKIHIWDAKDHSANKPKATLSRLDPDHMDHPSAVLSVVLSPDGKLIASSHQDGTIRLRDASSGDVLRIVGESKVSPAIAFSPDGKNIMMATIDGTIQLWNVETGTKLNSSKPALKPVAPRCLIYSPDNQWLVSGSVNGKVQLWDTSSLEPSQVEVTVEDSIASLCLSHDGKHLAVGNSAGIIKVYRFPDLDERLILRGHTETVHALSFAPSDDLIASGGEDKTIRLWETATGKEIAKLEKPLPPENSAIKMSSQSNKKTAFSTSMISPIRSLAFSSDGNMLVAGLATSLIEIWNIETQKHRQTLYGQSDSVVFAPKSSNLISGGNDPSILLWEPKFSLVYPVKVPAGIIGFSGPEKAYDFKVIRDDINNPESLLITGSGQSAGISVGPVALEKGKKYSAHGWVQVKDSSNTRTEVQIDFYNQSGQRLESLSPGRVRFEADEWQLAAVDQGTASIPESAKFVSASLRVVGASEIRVRTLELYASNAPMNDGNELENGSIENIAGINLPHWWINFKDNPTASIRWSDRNPRHGKFCLQLSGNGEYVEAHSDWIKPDFSRSYILKGFVRTVKGKCGLQIHYWGRDKKTRKREHLGKTVVPAISSSQWRELTLVSTLEKYPQAEAISVSAIARGSVEAWLDELRFVSVEKSAAAQIAHNSKTISSSSGLDKPEWFLAYDDSGSVEFQTTKVSGTDRKPVLYLKGQCKWAVVANKNRKAVAGGKDYVLTGLVQCNSGQAKIKIDYYKAKQRLGSEYSKIATANGKWEKLTVTFRHSLHPQTTHLAVAGS